MTIEAYSFDIFDTCLVRVWARPTDLFWELGCQLRQEDLIKISPEDWQSLRMEAEKSVRQLVPYGEITLEEVYQLLTDLLNWSPEQSEYVIKKEIILELQSLYPIPAILDRLRKLRHEGVKILYLSDMYLSERDILSFLGSKGVWNSDDTLYVSSHWKMNKATGKLFEHCLKQENLKENQIKHIGDNPHSDFLIPRKLGIQSELFDQAHLNRYEQKIADLNALPVNFRSLLAGISRLTRLQAPELESDEKIIWDTSANVVGPALFGFVHWCLTEANKRGLQRLYFVARDGQILNKIAQVLCKNWGYGIDCRYLYGSRQAWHFPAIFQIGDTELDWIFDSTQFLSVRSVCERVNLTPEKIASSLQQFEFDDSMWDENLASDQRNLLRQVFSQQTVVDLIVNTAKTYREQAIGYFRQEGIGDSVPFGIVDIGWHGRLQCSFSKLLNSAGLYPEKGLTGFYFALSKRIKAYSNDQLLAYFSDPDYVSTRDSLCSFRALFELFMTADHGGTMKLNRIDQKYVPLLRYEKNVKAIEWGLLVQQEAVCKFTNLFSQHLSSQYSTTSNHLLASELLLYEFIHHPTLQEAEVYGSFLFAEDQAENILYELAPKYKLSDCLRLLFKGKHIHQNVWFSATRARSRRASKMLLDKKVIAIAFRLQALKLKVKNSVSFRRLYQV